MATSKRERQRANRAHKQARDAKVKRREDAWRLIKKWVLIGSVIIASYLILALLLRS